MRIRIQHRTAYIYEQPASSIIQILRLTPRNHEGQRVRAWRIELDQDVHMQNGEDAFGNITHNLSFGRPLDDLTITVRGEVETHDSHGVVQGAVERFAPGLYLRETPLTQSDADIRAFAADVSGEGDTLGRLHNLLSAIHDTFTFETGLTDAHTTAAEAFALKKGVCQDFAHVFIAAARALEIPARYIGGYLLRSDGADSQQAAHAWAEAHVEGIGWIGFDPANCVSPSDSYIRVGMALDYLGAAPIRGSHRGGGEERLEVTVLTNSTGGQTQSQNQSSI